MTTYKVSEQFSRTPGSRYRRHGKHSGEDLQDTLAPLVKSVIESGDKILIDLDGGRSGERRDARGRQGLIGR